MHLMVLKRRSCLSSKERRLIATMLADVDRITGNGGYNLEPCGIVKVTTYNRDGKETPRYFRNGTIISWDGIPRDPMTTTKLAGAIRPLVHAGLLGCVDWATSPRSDRAP